MALPSPSSGRERRVSRRPDGLVRRCTRNPDHRTSAHPGRSPATHLRVDSRCHPDRHATSRWERLRHRAIDQDQLSPFTRRHDVVSRFRPYSDNRSIERGGWVHLESGCSGEPGVVHRNIDRKPGLGLHHGFGLGPSSPERPMRPEPRRIGFS